MIEYDFLQAKLHGIHSNSFVGEKLASLSKVTSIENLKSVLFPKENIVITGKRLYTHLERKFKENILQQILYIAEHFKFKNKFINTLLLQYEIDNVKFIVNSFYSLQKPSVTRIESEKKIKNLLRINIPNSLDYETVYNSDISNINDVKNIFNSTMYSFINPLLTENKEAIFIESELDKFYYKELLVAIHKQHRYERDILYPIVIEEMNWQNITWAFRLKMFFKKSFENSKKTFLTWEKLIPLKVLKNIFDFQFVKKDDIDIINKFPLYYRTIISNYHTQEGDFELSNLENKIKEILNKKYISFFYRENFNILPIIAFIYLKRTEYINIVRVIESLRYNV